MTDRITFGDCRAGCCILDVSAAGTAGHIVCYESYWTVANHSWHVPLRVWNVERPTEMFTVPARQGDTPVPFDIAAIGGTEGHVLTVYGPPPPVTTCLPACSGDLPTAWGLNPNTGHYAVMMALVERQLAGDHTAPPPTAGQIALRLGITVRQVHEHTDYLVRRLGVQPENGRRTPGWKRHALVRYAQTHAFRPAAS